MLHYKGWDAWFSLDRIMIVLAWPNCTLSSLQSSNWLLDLQSGNPSLLAVFIQSAGVLTKNTLILKIALVLSKNLKEFQGIIIA